MSWTHDAQHYEVMVVSFECFHWIPLQTVFWCFMFEIITMLTIRPQSSKTFGKNDNIQRELKKDQVIPICSRILHYTMYLFLSHYKLRYQKVFYLKVSSEWFSENEVYKRMLLCKLLILFLLSESYNLTRKNKVEKL